MSEPDPGTPPTLEALLVEHRAPLEGMVRRRAGWLARLESVEDLAQGVRLRALQAAEQFEYRGPGPFRAWLELLTRQQLADRANYWSAGRRNAGRMLRVTQMGTPSSFRMGVEPSMSRTGPVTLADRRDQLAIAIRAVQVLLPRDQQLIEWMREDVALTEVAARLDISYDAAERARLRAIERFRRAYRLLAVQAGAPPPSSA